MTTSYPRKAGKRIDTRKEAGIITASIVLHSWHGNVAKQVWLDGVVEWDLLKTYVVEGDWKGLSLRFDALPPKLKVVFARIDDPMAIKDRS